MAIDLQKILQAAMAQKQKLDGISGQSGTAPSIELPAIQEPNPVSQTKAVLPTRQNTIDPVKAQLPTKTTTTAKAALPTRSTADSGKAQLPTKATTDSGKAQLPTKTTTTAKAALPTRSTADSGKAQLPTKATTDSGKAQLPTKQAEAKSLREEVNSLSDDVLKDFQAIATKPPIAQVSARQRLKKAGYTDDKINSLVETVKTMNSEKQYADLQAQKAEESKILSTDTQEISKLSIDSQNDLRILAQGLTVMQPFANGFDFESSLQQMNEVTQEREAARNRLREQGYTDQRIDELVSSMSRMDNKQQTEAAVAAAQNAINEGYADGVLPWLGNRVTGFVGGITSFGEAVNDGIRSVFGLNDKRYTSADPNAPGYLFSAAANAADQARSEKILGENPTLMNELVNFGFQAVNSLADNGLRMLASGGSSAMSGLLASASAYGSTYHDSAERSANRLQGFLLSGTDAALEYFTEKMEADRLFNLVNAKGGAKIAADMLKGAGSEMVEEGASFFGNLIADAMVMAEKSDFNQRVNEMVANSNGTVSVSDARWEIAKQISREFLQTEAIAGVTGSIMSGASSITSYANSRMAQSANTQTQEVQQEAAQPAPAPADFSQQLNDTLANAVRAGNGMETQQTAPVTEEIQQPIETAPQMAYNGQEAVQQEERPVYPVTSKVGTSGISYTDDGQPVNFHYAVVSADSLVTSHDQYGNENANYPQELQGRDRSKLSSLLWVNTTAKNLNPALLADSPTAQNGAPIITPEGIVVSGNGRVSAIESAQGSGKASDYENMVREKAAQFGIDTTSMPKNPVLVRIADGVSDYTALSGKLNASTTARYSAVEQANSDAQNLDGIIQYLNPTESGKINKEFIQHFLDEIVPKSEQGSLMFRGKLNQDGIRRIEYALFSYAYGDTSMLSRISEQTDSNIKNVTNALLDLAPKMGELQQKIKNGEVQDLGLKNSIVDAVDLYITAKEEGTKVATIANQLESIKDKNAIRYSGLATQLAMYMEMNNRSGKNISALINALTSINSGMQEVDSDAMSLFDTSKFISQEELYNNAAERAKESGVKPEQFPDRIDFDQYGDFTPDRTEVNRNGQVLGRMDGSSQEGNTRKAGTDGESSSNAQREPAGVTQETVTQEQPSAETQQQNYTNQEQTQQEQTNTPQRDLEMTAEDVTQLQENRADYGAQRERYGQVRSPEVTNKDSDGRPVSQAAGNIQSSILTNDTMAKAANKLEINGDLSDDVQTNKQTIEMARQAIEEDGGVTRSLSEVRKVAESGKGSAVDAAKAALLYEYFQNVMDSSEKNSMEYRDAMQNAADAYVTLTKLSRNAARGVQIFSLFQRANPAVQKQIITREVKDEVARLVKRGVVKGGTEVEIDSDLLDAYADACSKARNAKTEVAKEAAKKAVFDAQQDIYKYAASQLHTTFWSMFDSWRHLSMLFNIKTHGRNFLGTGIFRETSWQAKRAVNAAAQAMFIRDPSKRTTALIGFGENNKAIYDWAINDRYSFDVQKALDGTTEYGHTAKGNVQENLKSFDFRGHAKFVETALNALSKFNSDALSNEDMFHKNKEYAKSLAGYLIAQGYTAEQVTGGKVSRDVMDAARTFAIQQAMRATFNDSNAVSDFVSKFNHINDGSIMGKLADKAAQSVLPYKKTPTNVAVRAAEFSPAGFVMSAFDMASSISGGSKTAADAIDHFASGLVGTSALVVGYALAAGIGPIRLRGKVSEDDKNEGHQDYSIEIGDNSYSIDWAAPATLPLLMGASFFEELNAESDVDVSAFSAFISASESLFSPMLELTYLSSLNDFINSVRYADPEEIPYKIVSNIMFGYFKQGIPILSRQAYTASKSAKMENFTNNPDKNIRELQSIAADIPFLGEALGLKKESVDNFGNVRKRPEGIIWNALDALANPGTYSKITHTDANDEIKRLNAAQDKDVTPNTPKKYLNYTDKSGEVHKNYRLTKKQYDTLEREQGEMSRDLVDELIHLPGYDNLTDEQKASALNDVYQYAAEMAKREAIEDYSAGGSKWMENLDNPAETILNRRLQDASGLGESKYNDAVKQGIDLESMQEIASVQKKVDATFSNMSNNWKKGGKMVDILGIDSAWKAYTQMSTEERKFFYDHADNNFKYYADSKAIGISDNTFLNLYRQYKMLPGDDKQEDAADWSQILAQAKVDGKITQRQFDKLKDRIKVWQTIPVDTVKFDDVQAAIGSPAKARTIVDNVKGLEPAEGYKDVALWQKFQAIANTKNLSESDVEKAIREYATNDSQLYTLDLFIHNGYTAKDYAEAYAVKSQAGTKKAQQTAALREAGFPQIVIDMVLASKPKDYTP